MTTRFQRYTTVPPHTRDPFAQDMLKWSAQFDVPSIGEDVLIRINGIGRAKVVGYASQGVYLGVMTVPYSPPDWWIRQNGLPSLDNAALAFGAEISRVDAGEGA
ncbi:hypothetical protein ABL840_04770 [Variovorax sp. NFACC27]|jgi:hypothetical protein|uniref:Uncharacterized protein n=1 Tax=Variovorax paradoxus TaxID=34073 RepID=A0A5Q0LWR4_VARPD|nr:hypothetical protein [Variovorax paradoxus]SEF19358.1 hypothetical protein SAMN03159371_00091 [Variovorax sp. NFACC28]SEF73477.1 hypothetical protein SAMN03159365_00726 [Variovorax sp. NFACC29]SFB77794.1 hypothetical protein SAMN03159379_00725 [Variovorax sp. NFACC26]SFG77266.1 hypothetical protein SAMN03159447_04848 [Variovorax sp. NFACC27]QFZ81870.1 hypothetical protein GFK26_03335 [Variovorax paradoxus]